MIRDLLWGLALLLLVPKQSVKGGGLVGAGCLEGVSLLHCDLSLLADGGLPHGAWKKAKVSSSSGKGFGKKKQECMQYPGGEGSLTCRKILRPSDTQVERDFG